MTRERISADDAAHIKSLEENDFQDLKAKEIKPAKLSEAISAFANTSGGELYIGIGEEKVKGKKRRVWSGFEDAEEANAIFQVLESMHPVDNLYRATFLEAEGYDGLVLHLVIAKVQPIIKATDDIPRVRRNAQNLRVLGEAAIRRLELDKGIATFEDETFDVDLAIITKSAVVKRFMKHAAPSRKPESFLRSQFVIRNDKPTVAGLLLFADEPQAVMPKRCAIKIYRYMTKEDAGTRDTLVGDPITIDGSAYDQIYRAVSEVRNITANLKVLGKAGFEAAKYPHETLHEIIANAVIHRDYSLTTDVHVRIYDNRIEVESPGRLPGHITVENLLDEQLARNPRIQRLIHKFPNPPNKDLGEGLNTAYEAMKKSRLQEPEPEVRATSLVYHIRHAPLASPHDAVMEYLKTHDEITNAIARDLTGIRSENVMKDVFIKLSQRDLIERVPGKLGSASAWRKFTGASAQPKAKKKPTNK